MGRFLLNFFGTPKHSAALKRATLLIVIFISIFLGIAAYGKFFFPSEKLKQLDFLTSCFEVAIIILLFAFRGYFLTWLMACVLFAAWGGYSLYWCVLKLPCGCVGSLMQFPTAYALALDALFFILSFTLAYLLGAFRPLLYLTVVCCLLFSLIGYVFAESVFYQDILGMRWSFFN
ncbi:MAG TPA: hypothetical protein VGJ00_01380 [Rhabdochlamydiaceae bacterium]|jgi:hypothetical protein